MTGQVIAANTTATRVERYRQAERALWEHYGMRPTERFVELTSPAVRLRVLEVGVGDPVLLVHGLIGPDAWAPLVRELRGFRCLVLDRPGWGLSSSIDYSKYPYKSITADLLAGVLDGLGIDRAHVIGGSIGTLWALRLAAAYPSRAGRVVLMGSGPLLSDIRVPTVLRMIASPLGALMIRRADADMLRSMLRQSGHAASLADGRMPEAFVDWRVSASRDTDAMRSERAMLRGGIVSWARPGLRQGLVFADAELGAITQPTLYVYGTADGIAPVDFARRVVGLLPHGELLVVEGGGHEPWFEDIDGVGSRVTSFLSAA
ncbi:MAG: alpha/beta hydrolase [Chloroflexota bacterium]|nr:alpha/beta hydrolase [Chloroflexota bacterium]